MIWKGRVTSEQDLLVEQLNDNCPQRFCASERSQRSSVAIPRGGTLNGVFCGKALRESWGTGSLEAVSKRVLEGVTSV